jgi:hypothetical protein
MTLREDVSVIERKIRKIRTGEALWSEDKHAVARAEKELERLVERLIGLKRSLRLEQESVGFYSGLTKSQLRQAGLCEADFY